MQFIDRGTAPGHLTKVIFPVVVLNSIITITWAATGVFF